MHSDFSKFEECSKIVSFKGAYNHEFQFWLELMELSVRPL
jgi:hypothetical protein